MGAVPPGRSARCARPIAHLVLWVVVVGAGGAVVGWWGAGGEGLGGNRAINKRRQQLAALGGSHRRCADSWMSTPLPHL